MTTPCWSRHLDNIGKPRPPVAWALTYGCHNGHVVSTSVCDRCAASLVDGHQRCARCFLPMVVSDLAPLGDPSQTSTQVNDLMADKPLGTSAQQRTVPTTPEQP